MNFINNTRNKRDFYLINNWIKCNIRTLKALQPSILHLKTFPVFKWTRLSTWPGSPVTPPLPRPCSLLVSASVRHLMGAGPWCHALPVSIVTAQTAPLLFWLFMVEKENNDQGKTVFAFINFTASSEWCVLNSGLLAFIIQSRFQTCRRVYTRSLCSGLFPLLKFFKKQCICNI